MKIQISKLNSDLWRHVKVPSVKVYVNNSVLWFFVKLIENGASLSPGLTPLSKIKDLILCSTFKSQSTLYKIKNLQPLIKKKL